MPLWRRNVTDAGKLTLVLLLAAFVVTWVILRGVTRSIRAGRGHLHDIDAGGTHLHHSTAGIVLLTVGAVAAIGLPAVRPWREIAAVVIGVGASLVFDEFAMILHLRDDYWQNEGRQSVEAVGLVAVRLTGVAVVAFTFAGVVVCAMKGKFRLGLIAIFVWPVALVGALRLARPGSRWDRRRYPAHPGRRARAAERAAAFDARWHPRWRHLADVLGGRPDPPAGPGVA